MKIHSFSSLLSIPLILSGGYLIYRLFDGEHRGEPPYVLIPVILLVTLYIFYGQIDHWWLTKFPPDLDEKIKTWLTAFLPYYRNLDGEKKLLFEQRLGLYVEAREFKMIGNKELLDVPFDIKNILATQAVKLSLGLKDYLIKDLDRIYCYKHPFPTPRYEFLHTYEIEAQDGLVILSLEQAIPGITNPDVYYNITLHAFAEAFMLLHNEVRFPDVHEYGWEGIEGLSNFSKELIQATCGYESMDLLPVHIVMYFEFPEAYQNRYPKEYQSFDYIFGR